MKITLWMVKTGVVVAAGLCLATAVKAGAEGTNLTELLQAGLFAEQGDHNLDAAIADYQTLATQYDKDRQLAATAVFRLGECYRAQNRTNEAAAQYHRVLKDFPDQKVLTTMSEQNLKGLGIGAETEPQFQQRLQAIIKPANNPAAGQETELLTLKTQYAELTNEMASLPPSQTRIIVQQRFPNDMLNKLISQSLDLQQQYKVALSDYSPTSITAVRIKKDLDAINQEIDDQINALMQAMKVEIAMREKTLEALRAQAGQHESVGGTESLQTATSVSSNDEDKEIQRIQDLIQNSPDLINRSDADGHTPLVKAAQNGWLKVATYLLDHGAEVNPQDHSTTPLCAATGVGNRTMVEFLLKHGAQVDTKVLEGDTALMAAAKKRYAAVIDVLLTNGADVNIRNQHGDTPLIQAVGGPVSIVQRLLDAGANVNVEANNGLSPLNKAIGRGSVDTIKLLLNAKADVNTPHNDELPIRLAAASGDTNIVELILGAGADPNLENKNGRTALSYAAERGAADCVKALLAMKADSNGGKNTLPLLAAIGAKDLPSAQLLLAAGADPNQSKQFLMDLHQPVDSNYQTRQYNGMNALWLAVWMAQPEMVRLLAAHKADLGDSSDYGRSILFRTFWQTNLLSVLLDAGGDPNARDKNDGRRPTLIQVAADYKLATAADLLLQHGADPNLTDTSGDTALHRALYPAVSRGEGTNVIALLLAHGANPNIRNNQGQTPLMIAKTSQIESLRPWLCDLLRQHGALDKLPDWDRIEISRADANFLAPVFFKATNDWNHFTLCETLLNCYDNARDPFNTSSPLGLGGPRPVNNPFPHGPSFPDFSRIIIIRPSHDSTNESRITVNLLNDASQVDGTKDVPLEFGDVVEIPERDHALGENFIGLNPGDKDALASHLRGHVSLLVKGKPNPLEIYPEPQWALLKRILADNTARSVLLASSDLSQVKVTRHDKVSGKEMTWTVDCRTVEPVNTGASPFQMRLNNLIMNGGGNTAEQEMAGDLWLRDGDIVDVPEKP